VKGNTPSHILQSISSLNEIAPELWDALANPVGQPFNPFVSHRFLLALEQSGCTTARSGWKPAHLVLEQNEIITGIAPCYLKSHSMGEYVFDHAWADAFGRAGGNYYPKLQVSVPFTPATGPRLLATTSEARKLLAAGLKNICKEQSASSAHLTFLNDTDASILESEGYLLRNDIQFHWRNEGYADFEGFLASLASSKRKNIRKERKAVAENGITFVHATGDTLKDEHWDYFFTFYMDTGARKWGRPYLTRNFFARIHDTMRDEILLVLAYREGRCIAGALNFIGSETLFGRNWGCTENHTFLHFETCYYQAMDFAIMRGLTRVEAGAQGEHKLARGYMPVKTTSAHFLAHPGLQKAVKAYLAQERAAVAHDQELLAEHAPFRRKPDQEEQE
jgi:uncharacterized protein